MTWTLGPLRGQTRISGKALSELVLQHEEMKTGVKTLKLSILSIFNLLQKSCEETINAGESVERREPSYIAGGM